MAGSSNAERALAKMLSNTPCTPGAFLSGFALLATFWISESA